MAYAAAANPLGCSAEEWQARCELAACYRIFHKIGWTEMIYNHISLRVPGPERHFLINAFGRHYSEITASNLLKVDLEGNILPPVHGEFNAAGFVPHSALHKAIPEAHCIMHTHTTAGMAVACAVEGLAMTNFYAAQLGGRVAYHDFEGITVHPGEGERLVKNIGNKPVCILRNHGLLAWGPSVASALQYLWVLQRACEIQVAGAALRPAISISPEVQQRCQQDVAAVNKNPDLGREMFEAMKRLVTRDDPSYLT